MLQTQKIVVAGVLCNKGKFLVLQRNVDESIFPGKWELPSGKVNFGEDPYDALKREIKEETGIDILNANPLTCTHYTIEKEDNKRHTVQIIYLAYADEKSIINIGLSNEHKAYKWIFPKELNDLDTFDDMITILEEAEKSIK